MKASELILYLQQQMAIKGDVDVQLHGPYGSLSDLIEPMSDEQVHYEELKKFINLSTDLTTG